MHFHNTIRRYTATLLDVFSRLEVQEEDSNGVIRSKNIPITFSNREKSSILSEREDQTLLTGNLNVIPRANLAISSIQSASERQGNKNSKIGKKFGNREIDFMYNSVAYNINYELSVMVRGYNQAFMIIEQVVPLFNPDLNLDIYDADGLEEPSRIKVGLLDTGMEQPAYDETSNNLVRLDFGLMLYGQIYSPITSLPRIKEFYSRLNLGSETVGFISSKVKDSIPKDLQFTTTHSGLDIELKSILFDERFLEIDLINNSLVPIHYKWNILRGNMILNDPNSPKTGYTGSGTNIIECVVYDDYNNYQKIQKTVMI